MALLQALIALIGRSVGRILNAVFGWAVRALFGFVSGARKALLTGVVALAALWPLLLLGIAFPRVATFVVAFVPVAEEVPDWPLRVGWLALAVFAPGLLGVTLAAQQSDRPEKGSFLARAARGYPTTLGLSLAFWLSFVTVPVQKIVSLVRRQSDAYVPLVTTGSAYAEAARRIEESLDSAGFRVARAQPGFWSGLPTRVLARLAGDALVEYVPREVAYLRGPELEATLFPAGLLLRGREEKTAFAHGVVVEALANSDAFQTTTPEAQEIERKIRRVWSVLERHPAHVDSRVLAARLDDISDEIAALEAPYDDWQTVYRQALQLARALDGEPQLLERKPTREGVVAMEPNESERLSTIELMKEITAKATQLVRKELELARTEFKQDLRTQIAMAKLLGVAALLGIVAVTMLFVAAALALALVVPGWAAALIVAGGTAAIAAVLGVIGWKRRVVKPLERTRKSVEEDVEWAKERMA
jgi:hypothetical protein